MRKTSFPADICWSNVLYYLKFIVKKFLGFKKANKSRKSKVEEEISPYEPKKRKKSRKKPTLRHKKYQNRLSVFDEDD